VGAVTLLDDVPTGALVGLDSAPLIYYIEQHATYHPIVQPFFEDRVQKALNSIVTSVVSLAEVLVLPFKVGRADLVQAYRDFFAKAPQLTMVSISVALAEQAAHLRGQFNLRLPDALQIAAALELGATHFITNDIGLRRVTKLKVLVLDDYLPVPSP
jgi:predicted nucleic acid-binding protein